MATLVTLAVASVAPAHAQREIRGALDFEQTLDDQIERLERMVGGDAAAYKQVVILQWLIELYELAGRYDDVERCFERILAFYPDDIGTLNAYARFLMERRGDPERAQKFLNDAHLWEKSRDNRSMLLGETYEIWAGILYRIENYERAVTMSEQALDLQGENASPELLRTYGKSLVARKRYDDAAEAYFRLIGVVGADPEIVNEMQLFIGKTSRYSEGSIGEVIARAAEEARAARLAAIEAGGGRVVDVDVPAQEPLEATLRRADGPGAVLFVPDVGADRGEFTPYGQLLFIDDITSLSIDAGTVPARIEAQVASPAYNVDQMIARIAAAYGYLTDELGLDEKHVAIVSAGSGCALVEKAIHAHRLNPAVVYLSPTFTAEDRELTNAMSFHPDRTVVVMYGSEDIGSMRSLSVLQKSARRATIVPRQFDRAGFGIDILRRVPAALEYLQGWARNTLAQP